MLNISADGSVSGVLFITCGIHEQLLLLLHWLLMSAVFWLSYVLCTIWGATQCTEQPHLCKHSEFIWSFSMMIACGSTDFVMTFDIMFLKSARMAMCIACAESPHTSQTYGKAGSQLTHAAHKCMCERGGVQSPQYWQRSGACPRRVWPSYQNLP